MEYTVITAPDHETLVRLVNAKLTEGWRPQGGIALLNIHQANPQPAMVLAQAVTRG